VKDVWDLWTTKDGIESWWGPDGFSVTVKKLDLRAGGELLYAMTAVSPEMIAFMKQAGMPTSHDARITYKEIVPHRRLAYVNHADFMGVAPYEIAQEVELHQMGDRVRMVLTMDPAHDELWTQRMVQGWESELGKLAKILPMAA
jgi:uncharacterized protein YndB with AHSA1/START domain